jgi:hypothetical protein
MHGASYSTYVAHASHVIEIITWWMGTPPYNPSLSMAFCTIRFSSHRGCVRHLLEGEGLRGRAHAEMKERHPRYPYWLGTIRW